MNYAVLHQTKTQEEERKAPAAVRQGRYQSKEEAGFSGQTR